MILTIGVCRIRVQREVSDPKITTDSTFMYHVKKCLQKMGADCIKKPAWKDGNLVDESLYYIRERKKGEWMMYDSSYVVRDIWREYAKKGEAVLTLEGTINWKKGKENEPT